MTRWNEEDYQAYVSGKTPTEKKPSKYHNEKPTAERTHFLEAYQKIIEGGG